jgi:hypothetical protein
LNPQLESRDYNKMNTNIDGYDGDAVAGDGYDTQSSLDPNGGEDCALLLDPSPDPFRR